MRTVIKERAAASCYQNDRKTVINRRQCVCVCVAHTGDTSHNIALWIIFHSCSHQPVPVVPLPMAMVCEMWSPCRVRSAQLCLFRDSTAANDIFIVNRWVPATISSRNFSRPPKKFFDLNSRRCSVCVCGVRSIWECIWNGREWKVNDANGEIMRVPLKYGSI